MINAVIAVIISIIPAFAASGGFEAAARIPADLGPGFDEREPLSGPEASPDAGSGAWLTAAGGLIAHAGGGIDGKDGTNSREAVELNYSLGHRVFELDFKLTRDGSVAVVHDWALYAGQRTMEEYRKARADDIYDDYSAMSYIDVCGEMAEKPDMWLVTDTKSFEDDDPAETREMFEIMTREAKERGVIDRIIPQIYNQEMYSMIMGIYPFKNIIYTLYESPDSDEEAARFVADKDNIRAVTMAPARFSAKFGKALRDEGKKVFFFTLNDPEEAARWRKEGVDGFYTDFIKP
ncbi:MAG: hypothetical protein LBU36_03585 [Clostridiales bacterium]|jgi:glycerophosphoryl diester phosphodiesterase|nr:hypothetical protein [Clostridiales bacterium]